MQTFKNDYRLTEADQKRIKCDQCGNPATTGQNEGAPPFWYHCDECAERGRQTGHFYPDSATLTQSQASAYLSLPADAPMETVKAVLSETDDRNTLRFDIIEAIAEMYSTTFEHVASDISAMPIAEEQFEAFCKAMEDAGY